MDIIKGLNIFKEESESKDWALEHAIVKQVGEVGGLGKGDRKKSQGGGRKIRKQVFPRGRMRKKYEREGSANNCDKQIKRERSEN